MRQAVGARRDEDLWVELAAYPTRAEGLRLIRRLRKTGKILEKARAAERWNRRRAGSWTVDYATLQSA